MAENRQRQRGLLVTEPKEGDGSAPHFQSKFGLIVSCLGCVVGTGNIWRFPRIVATNSEEKGGLVFLLVWFLFLILWSCPMLLVEYATGRYTKKAVIGSFQQFVGKKFVWCGAWICMVTFFISCYYSVVLGWCFYYFIYFIGHELPTRVEDSNAIYKEFAEESTWPVLTHFLAVFISAMSVMFGVRGIERVNMVLVPVLLLIILVTFVWSLTREYADQGITFLFTPSWESFGKPRVWVDAVSQNAFDTGAGMGLLVPYSTFMTQNHGVVKYSYFIPAVNNLVSLICGILIFSTVFSTLIVTRTGISHNEIVSIMKDSGPASTGLTFIWIPVLFESIGSFGRVLTILFFLCLSFAGVTSLISNMELCTHTLYDFGVPRRFATLATAVLTFLVGLMSALNIDILTNQDFVWAFALLINGLMFQLMVIRFGTANFRKNVINEYSTDDWYLFKYWEWIIKVVAPLEAVALIVWWAIDLIDNDAGDGEEWYKFGKETLVTTLTQWIGVMVILILINGIWLWFLRRRGTYNYYDNDEKTHLLSSEKDESGKESSYTLGDKNKLHNTFQQTSEIGV